MGPFCTRDPATSSSPRGGRAFSSKVSIGSNTNRGLFFNKEVAKTGLIFKKKSGRWNPMLTNISVESLCTSTSSTAPRNASLSRRLILLVRACVFVGCIWCIICVHVCVVRGKCFCIWYLFWFVCGVFLWVCVFLGCIRCVILFLHVCVSCVQCFCTWCIHVYGCNLWPWVCVLVWVYSVGDICACVCAVW